MSAMKRMCKKCKTETLFKSHGETDHCPSRASRKRWRCVICGSTQSEKPDEIYIKTLAPIAVLTENEKQIKAIALFVMSVPASVIEKRLHIKGSTIFRTLKKIYHADALYELYDLIYKKYPNFAEYKIDEIASVFEGNSVDAQAIRKAGIQRSIFWKNLRTRELQDEYCQYLTSNIVRLCPLNRGRG